LSTIILGFWIGVNIYGISDVTQSGRGGCKSFGDCVSPLQNNIVLSYSLTLKNDRSQAPVCPLAFFSIKYKAGGL